MAKVNSEQSFNIKHRLVGAIVLLGLGVVFIPMILQGNGPGGVMKADNLTEEVQEWIVETEDATTYTSRVIPVGEENTSVETEPVAVNSNSTPELVVIDDSEIQPLTQPQTQSEPAVQQIQETQAEEKQQAEPEKQEPAIVEQAKQQPTQVASLKSENVSRGWMVQVGTFSKPENAQNLISKLNKNGFDSRYEVIDTDSGQATRVWVGPYEKRVTAGRALETVKEMTGVKGFIKAYP